MSRSVGSYPHRHCLYLTCFCFSLCCSATVAMIGAEIKGCSSVVEQLSSTQCAGGSNPSSPAKATSPAFIKWTINKQLTTMASNLKLFNQTITDVKTQNYLQNVLGERKGEFVNNLTALVSNNKQLQECEPTTLMFAALKATALDLPLDPNLGFAHVLPYRNNKEGKVEAQFQIGYKGISQLAIRSGQFKTINVTDVREGELKGRDRRTGYVTIEWIEDFAEREKAKVVGYLGYFKLLNGYEKESYWSVEELQKHGLLYSQTYKKGYGVWKDNFDAMSKKTVLKLMLNKGDAPMSVQMQQAVKYDQSVILDEDGNARYIDNERKPASEEQAAQFLEAEEAQVVEENPNNANDLFSGEA